jgi:hypothetical protein
MHYNKAELTYAASARGLWVACPCRTIHNSFDADAVKVLLELAEVILFSKQPVVLLSMVFRDLVTCRSSSSPFFFKPSRVKEAPLAARSSLSFRWNEVADDHVLASQSHFQSRTTTKLPAN